MPAARNMDEFIKNIKIAWKKLEKDTDYLDKLTHSMPKSMLSLRPEGTSQSIEMFVKLSSITLRIF